MRFEYTRHRTFQRRDNGMWWRFFLFRKVIFTQQAINNQNNEDYKIV